MSSVTIDESQDIRNRESKEDPDFVITGNGDSDKDSDSEFEQFDDDLEEELIKEKGKKKVKLSIKEREQLSRNKTRNISKSKSRPLNEPEDDDFQSSLRSNEGSFILANRVRRSASQQKIIDDLPNEYFFDEDEEISAQEAEKLLNAAPLPQIEMILGFKEDEEGKRKYLCKYVREPIAHAVYLDEEEIPKHRGGQTHLESFQIQEDDYGIKDSLSIPGLKVPGIEETEEEAKREVDRIVYFDEDKKLYLVKWKNSPYEYATWEQTVNDEDALNRFKRRNAMYRTPPPPRPKTCKPYGEGPDFIPIPHYKNGNKLRDYQVDALNWLRQTYYADQNTILADEMGLGKTVMCIAMINDIVRNCGIDGPFLIVAPLGTLPNWQRELATWTNLDAILFHGSQQDRELIREKELFFPPPRQTTPKFQVLLTNIETVIKSIDIIQSVKWHFVIIDEAHRLKNLNSKIYSVMFSLTMEHVLLMTGTPIQNSVDEIYALLHFIAPLKFESLDEFRKEYGNIENAEDIAKLQSVIAPYMLRRKKKNVEASIGGKEETIVEVELTKTQKFYYRMLIDKRSKDLKQHKSHALAQDLNNLAMQLRKMCNHPFLFPHIEEEVVKPGEEEVDAMINASGKLVFVDKLLAKLKPTGSKVLIFSQMVNILNILEDFLNYRGYTYVRLDGGVVGEERQEAIDKFNDVDQGVFVFLLCTRAGGVGLNLTAANTVIIYDSDWNPQNDLQAQARCHRIGQTQEVKVYRLITRGTYESDMFARASMKLGLDQAILDSNQGGNTEMTPKEIERLIKRGAYYIFNEDDGAADEFVSEDIDAILERRTKTLTRSAVDQGSVFSKTTFVVDRDGEQIDLNDKNFWDRVVPEHLKDTFKQEEEVLGKRRVTRAVYSDLEYEGEKKRGPKPQNGGFGWTIGTRDLLLQGLLRYGWGRWSEIHAHSRAKCDLQACQDACIVLLFLISSNIPDASDFLSLIIQTDEIELTKAQKKIRNSSAFVNQKFSKIVHQDAEFYATRLKQIHAITEWHNEGEKPVKFDGEGAPSGDWPAKNDYRLMHAAWECGWDNWDAIKECNVWEKVRLDNFQRDEVMERLEGLANTLIARADEEIVEDVGPTIPQLSVTEMKSLLQILAEVGIPSADSPQWAVYDRYFGEDSRVLVARTVECCRVVAYNDPHAQPAMLKKMLAAIVPSGDYLIPSLSHQAATHIRDNLDWHSMLVEQMKNPPIIPPEVPTHLVLPSFWSAECDAALLKHTAEFQFGDPYSLVLENPAIAPYVSEADAEVLRISRAHFEKHHTHKRIRGELAFFFEEYSVVERIEEIMASAGGWTVPRVVDVPDTPPDRLEFPAFDGSVTVESTGDGEVFCLAGYAYRVGLQTNVRHGKVHFTCKVIDKDLFEVRKSNRQAWSAATPLEAWIAADKDFDDDAALLFGAKNHAVQFYLDSLLTPKMRRELGPDPYTQPTFVRFKNVSGKRK